MVVEVANVHGLTVLVVEEEVVSTSSEVAPEVDGVREHFGGGVVVDEDDECVLVLEEALVVLGGVVDDPFPVVVCDGVEGASTVLSEAVGKVVLHVHLVLGVVPDLHEGVHNELHVAPIVLPHEEDVSLLRRPLRNKLGKVVVRSSAIAGGRHSFYYYFEKEFRLFIIYH